jgi:hypothetical protein
MPEEDEVEIAVRKHLDKVFSYAPGKNKEFWDAVNQLAPLSRSRFLSALKKMHENPYLFGKKMQDFAFGAAHLNLALRVVQGDEEWRVQHPLDTSGPFLDQFEAFVEGNHKCKTFDTFHQTNVIGLMHDSYSRRKENSRRFNSPRTK